MINFDELKIGTKLIVVSMPEWYTWKFPIGTIVTIKMFHGDGNNCWISVEEIAPNDSKNLGIYKLSCFHLLKKYDLKSV